MAWTEQHGDKIRVRFRRNGTIVNDATFDDPAEAASHTAHLNNVALAVKRQLSPAPPPTLDQWVETWLPAHAVAFSTTTKYRHLLRKHISPAFGDQRLNAITRTDVKTFAKDLGGHLAPDSVRSIVTLLGLVLREAIAEHLLFFDPTARLRLRDGPAEPRPVATLRQVLEIADRMPHQHARTLIITAAYTGMRFGELAGLSRDNVHLDRALIHVSATDGALHEVSGERWLGPPKTKAGVRDIHLPAFLVDLLDDLLHAHPYPTVFCTEAGRWMWRTTFATHTWRPACDGHARRGCAPIIGGLRFHDLRHAHRTWMDEDTIAEPLKAQRLGHQIPGIRGVYAHATEPMQPPLLAALQERWLTAGGHR